MGGSPLVGEFPRVLCDPPVVACGLPPLFSLRCIDTTYIDTRTHTAGGYAVSGHVAERPYSLFHAASMRLRMALRLRLGGSVVGSELGPLPEEAGSATRREEWVA